MTHFLYVIVFLLLTRRDLELTGGQTRSTAGREILVEIHLESDPLEMRPRPDRLSAVSATEQFPVHKGARFQ